ncbi:MAG: hypothetical protein IAB81_07600 [Bacteroidetes bacterium]|uniref:Uncharacterized protein n=1 Tax=Candidatus Merdivivens pullicola TaxID=2840872 RepID=A0A9D9IJ85_9BACT|nr:hypothetical protein [Candidatus Merdivivens pullicola]
MKKVLKTVAAAAAASLMLLAVSCNQTGPEPQKDVVKYELKGDVLSVRSVPYVVDSAGNETIEASMNNIYAEFNDFGMITLLQRFNKEGKMVSEEKSLYNERGQILESQIVSADGATVEKTVYVYKRGRLATMTVTDAQDSLKKHEVYKYYGKDSVKAVFSYKEGKTAGRRIMKYDENGFNTENVTYSDKNKVLSSFVLGYDEAGRNVSIESENIFFGDLDSDMTYDENGFRSSLTMKGKQAETVFTFKFRLDSLGNWIERATYKNGSENPIRIERREIEYR